jgi:hypothetical protein
MAQVIMSALDQWSAYLQPALTPRLPTGPEEPNQHLHKLINDAFVHQNNIGWGIFYEAEYRYIGSSALLSIIRSVSQETRTIRRYG